MYTQDRNGDTALMFNFKFVRSTSNRIMIKLLVSEVIRLSLCTDESEYAEDVSLIQKNEKLLSYYYECTAELNQKVGLYNIKLIEVSNFFQKNLKKISKLMSNNEFKNSFKLKIDSLNYFHLQFKKNL